jgi:hypothetical protein
MTVLLPLIHASVIWLADVKYQLPFPENSVRFGQVYHQDSLSRCDAIQFGCRLRSQVAMSAARTRL